MTRSVNVSFGILLIVLFYCLSCGKKPTEPEYTWFNGCVEWTVTGIDNQHERVCGIKHGCTWSKRENGYMIVAYNGTENTLAIWWKRNPESIVNFPYTEDLINGCITTPHISGICTVKDLGLTGCITIEMYDPDNSELKGDFYFRAGRYTNEQYWETANISGNFDVGCVDSLSI